MKFSVVICNHNYDAFLRRAIDSTLAQTCPAQDVIVVDDGSTDTSRAIIEGYGSRIKSVFQPQTGHVSALNAGFAASSGDAVLFLDADDVLYPHCLARAEALFEDGLSKIQFRLDTIDGAGHNLEAPFPYFPPDLTSDEILRQSLEFGVYPWTVSSGNVFARRYLAQVLPIDITRIYRSPDGYLSKMAPLYGPVKTSPEIIGAYRVHGANTWARANTGLREYAANRWVGFDRVLCDAFNAKAIELGYKTRDYDELVSVQRIEHRLMGFRADHSHYPMQGESAYHLFALGKRSARLAPNISSAGRIAWTIWFAMLAFAPFWMIDIIYKSARTQKQRSPIARIIVKLAQGPAGFGRHAVRKHDA